MPRATSAPFGPRYAHASVIDGRGRLLVIGGARGDQGGCGGAGCYLNDVWASEDGGAHWEEIHSPVTRRFPPRRGHAAATDKAGVLLVVAGGFCGRECEGTRLLNDFWCSSDGGDIWRDLGEHVPAPWSARHGHAMVMTPDNTLLLLGGHDGQSYLNDAYRLDDAAHSERPGAAWLRLAGQPWGRRYGHAAAVAPTGDVFLLGGMYSAKESGQVDCLRDVWRSADKGGSWGAATGRAPWTGRYQHAAAADSTGALLVVGGISADLQRLRDTWRSEDRGSTWRVVAEAAPWAPRYEHTVVVDANDSLYVIGGLSAGEEKFDDVWRSIRTCADLPGPCSGRQTCRDGTHRHFGGIPGPVCVGRCDARVFNSCGAREKCALRHGRPVCVNPCATHMCEEGKVCEVAERGASLDAVGGGKPLPTAAAFCLSCRESQTKFACDKLLQCVWTTSDERCNTRCSSFQAQGACQGSRTRGGDARCDWHGGPDECRKLSS